MLNPKATENFIDLYSGSGQWTFLSGGIYNRTYSIDIKKYSREGFMVNAAKNKVRNCSFVTEKISSEFLKKFIAEEPEFKTTVMLDGPTGQLEDGILRTLAEKKVQRIIHVFDDINAVPEQIRKWRKHGYILKKIIPFDSKPFSGQVECIALLNIDFLGLLDKTKTLKKKQIKTGPKANTSGIRFVQD